MKKTIIRYLTGTITLLIGGLIYAAQKELTLTMTENAIKLIIITLSLLFGPYLIGLTIDQLTGLTKRIRE